MRYRLSYILIFAFIFGVYSTSYSLNFYDDPASTLTVVKTSVEMSDNIANPPVNNFLTKIEIQFNDAPDPSLLQSNIKLYKINESGVAVDFPINLRIDEVDPNLVILNTKPVSEFPKGCEFKLVVGSGLKTEKGKAFGKEVTGYFATNISIDLLGTGTPKAKRTKTVVISDIHLGIDSKFAENNENLDNLVEFLGKVRISTDIKELVIAGDLLDQWFIPMDYKTPLDGSALIDAIAANNKPFVNAINALIKDGIVKVTYTPGNHDLTATEADLERVFPGINQVRGSVQGLGEYVTGEENQIVIEHGHKYNFFCAPDPLSNKNITKDYPSVMPVGYFFTRIATSSIVQGKPKSENSFPELKIDKNDPEQLLLYYYYLTWKGILTTLPVKEKFSDKAIITNIDGLNDTYAMKDVIPQVNPSTGKLEVNLYNGSFNQWDKRQEINGVKVKIPAADAILGANDDRLTDLQSKVQYFDVDASKRIVIFGHTHKVQIIPFENLKGQKTIYANSGTWIDHSLKYPNSTFAVVAEPEAGSPVTIVNVFQYSGNGSYVEWEKPQAITK